jgi:hypothetical protein
MNHRIGVLNAARKILLVKGRAISTTDSHLCAFKGGDGCDGFQDLTLRLWVSLRGVIERLSLSATISKGHRGRSTTNSVQCQQLGFLALNRIGYGLTIAWKSTAPPTAPRQHTPPCSIQPFVKYLFTSSANSIIIASLALLLNGAPHFTDTSLYCIAYSP